MVSTDCKLVYIISKLNVQNSIENEHTNIQLKCFVCSKTQDHWGSKLK